MKKFETQFRWSAIIVLSVTALAKLISSTGQAQLLALPDPLFGLAHRDMLIGAGLLEIGIVVALLARIHPRIKHLLLLWLSTCFLIYRISFRLINPGKPCPCLGSLTEKLPLSQSAIDTLLVGIVLFLLFGSLSMLLTLGRQPLSGPFKHHEAHCNSAEGIRPASS
jgi:hypothetical protein